MPTMLPRSLMPARPRAAAGSLEDLPDRILRAGAGDRITIADVLGTVGERSFGPLIALGGLVIFSPLGVIPTLPSLVALGVGLVAAQLLVGLPRIWLPGFLLRRSMARERMRAAVDRVRPLTASSTASSGGGSAS